MLDKLGRSTAAIYLAGYAVECILKALLLSITPARHRAAVLKSFRGGVGHDLNHLRRQIARYINIPPELASHLAFAATWSVDLRYEPGEAHFADAERFVDAARRILEWADRRL